MGFWQRQFKTESCRGKKGHGTPLQVTRKARDRGADTYLKRGREGKDTLAKQAMISNRRAVGRARWSRAPWPGLHPSPFQHDKALTTSRNKHRPLQSARFVVFCVVCCGQDRPRCHAFGQHSQHASLFNVSTRPLLALLTFALDAVPATPSDPTHTHMKQDVLAMLEG